MGVLPPAFDLYLDYHNKAMWLLVSELTDLYKFIMQWVEISILSRQISEQSSTVEQWIVIQLQHPWLSLELRLLSVLSFTWCFCVHLRFFWVLRFPPAAPKHASRWIGPRCECISLRMEFPIASIVVGITSSVHTVLRISNHIERHACQNTMK